MNQITIVITRILSGKGEGQMKVKSQEFSKFGRETYPYCVVIGVDKVAVVWEPADPEHDQDDDEHLGQLPLVVHLAPVAHTLLRLHVAPEGGAQVTVGHGEAQHRQHVGHQEEENLGMVSSVNIPDVQVSAKNE